MKHLSVFNFIIANIFLAFTVQAQAYNGPNESASEDDSCIEMTDERVDEINEIVEAITELIKQLNAKNSTLDTKLVKLVIDKHRENEDEESPVLELFINDCGKEHTFTRDDLNKNGKHQTGSSAFSGSSFDSTRSRDYASTETDQQRDSRVDTSQTSSSAYSSSESVQQSQDKVRQNNLDTDSDDIKKTSPIDKEEVSNQQTNSSAETTDKLSNQTVNQASNSNAESMTQDVTNRSSAVSQQTDTSNVNENTDDLTAKTKNVRENNEDIEKQSTETVQKTKSTKEQSEDITESKSVNKDNYTRSVNNINDDDLTQKSTTKSESTSKNVENDYRTTRTLRDVDRKSEKRTTETRNEDVFFRDQRDNRKNTAVDSKSCINRNNFEQTMTRVIRREMANSYQRNYDYSQSSADVEYCESNGWGPDSYDEYSDDVSMSDDNVEIREFYIPEEVLKMRCRLGRKSSPWLMYVQRDEDSGENIYMIN